MFNTLDLFAGIGGFSLGLERTGQFRTVAFCEANKNCRRVLEKHWPDVPIFDDVRLLTKEDLDERVDVITGGFPCQDISTAGPGAGLAGARSGLWFEYARLIDELRPKAAIIENVSALRSRGLDKVLGSLAALGYDAEWHCLPASAFGAEHPRDRVWIIAYPSSWDAQARYKQGILGEPDSQGKAAGFANGGLPTDWQWCNKSRVCRIADGVPRRMDRLGQLGNAVVPPIPTFIGHKLADALRNHNVPMVDRPL